MARSISQTLTLAHLVRTSSSAASISSSSRRCLSKLASSDSGDVDSSSPNADPLIRKLEDAIHTIIARRSEPDWLPFLPGASYWVPPPSSPSIGLTNLLHDLTEPVTTHHVSMPPLTTPPAMPSSSFFINGISLPFSFCFHRFWPFGYLCIFLFCHSS